jgi:hypothetical protein
MTALSVLSKTEITIKNHRFSINDTEGDDYASGNWLVISGVNTFTRGTESTDVDASDFDSAGWGSDFSVTKKFSIGIQGHYLVDEVTGDKNSGQQLAEQAAHGFGPSAFRWVKMEALNTARDTVIGSIIIQASAKLGESGGGMEDLEPWILCQAA